MDFWALLQQTQQNLQDMLVDLETAKIELDLSNGRADEAENNADALKIQLAAAQQKNNALEGQVQHLQSRYVSCSVADPKIDIVSPLTESQDQEPSRTISGSSDSASQHLVVRTSFMFGAAVSAVA